MISLPTGPSAIFLLRTPDRELALPRQNAALQPLLPFVAAIGGSVLLSSLLVRHVPLPRHRGRDYLLLPAWPGPRELIASGAVSSVLRWPPYMDVQPANPDLCAAVSPLRLCQPSNAYLRPGRE